MRGLLLLCTSAQSVSQSPAAKKAALTTRTHTRDQNAAAATRDGYTAHCSLSLSLSRLCDYYYYN